jgi:hypothetical protein
MSMKEKLSDQLRRLILTGEKSRYRISKETGIDAGTLCRFVKGQAGLSIPVLDKVAECLGLRIVADKPRAATRKAKR